MTYLKQIRFQKEDKSSFLVPKLKKEIRKKEHELKRINNTIIMIGCFISFFSTKYIEYSLDYILNTYNFKGLFKITQYLMQIFSCLLSGFIIDIISIKSTWRFFIMANILNQMIYVSFVYYNNIQFLALAMLLNQFLNNVCIINFSCILYEAATKFKVRLNNAVKLEAYGDFFPSIIQLSLSILINKYLKINDEQLKQTKKDIVIYQIMFCQVLNLISLLILDKTYKQIENIKTQSNQYKKFLIYKGVGLSFLKILKYFNNRNVYFLLIISAVCGCQNDQNAYQVDEMYNSLEQVLIVNAIGVIFGVLVMKIINDKQKLVQTCYKVTSYCLYLYLISSFLLIIIEIISKETNLLSHEIQYIFKTLIYGIKEILFFVVYCLIHQMIIILLPNRSSMRAIGLSITLLPYFCFNALGNLSQNIIILRIVQIIITIITIIIDYIYQKNLQYNLVELKLSKLYKEINS